MADTHAPSPEPVADLTAADIRIALRRGLADFRRAPAFGLAFGAFYVVIGLVMVGATIASGHTFYAIAITLGFPLIAPFAAVGLYETSRRIEAGEPLRWRPILGVVWAEHARQLPWFGAIMIIWFGFYVIVSHVIFAVTMGPAAMTNILSSYELFLSPRGLSLIFVEIVVGAIFAWVVFAACVVSLPMMMAREVDFVTAMLTSFQVVGANFGTMLLWAASIVVLLALALVPAFLGLFVVLPVLGHATWHLYRRAVPSG